MVTSEARAGISGWNGKSSRRSKAKDAGEPLWSESRSLFLDGNLGSVSHQKREEANFDTEWDGICGWLTRCLLLLSPRSFVLCACEHWKII